MNKLLISLLIIMTTALVITGCTKNITSNTKQSSVADFQIDTCRELAKKLDGKIIDTNNPPGYFIIDGFEEIVGGTLLNISEPSYDLECTPFSSALV